MKFIMYEVNRGTGYASLINSEDFIAKKKKIQHSIHFPKVLVYCNSYLLMCSVQSRLNTCTCSIVAGLICTLTY